jgi:hypothetical protein
MYPKRFFRDFTEPIKKGTVFVLMPFAEEFKPIYELIKRTLEGSELRLSCYRSDEVYKPEPIVEKILRGIAESELIIADITSRNPNVFYELGIAHTVKDNCIILAQTMDDVPFDLRHLYCIIYSNKLSGAEDLKQNLIKTVSEILKQSDSSEERKEIKKTNPAKWKNAVEPNEARQRIDMPKSNLLLEIGLIIEEYTLYEFVKNKFMPRIRLNINVLNKGSTNVDILSIKFAGLIDFLNVYQTNLKNCTFPINISPGENKSFSAYLDLAHAETEAKFANELAKKDIDSYVGCIRTTLEAIDQERQSHSAKAEQKLLMKPIKELYISLWQKENKSELLRIVR